MDIDKRYFSLLAFMLFATIYVLTKYPLLKDAFTYLIPGTLWLLIITLIIKMKLINLRVSKIALIIGVIAGTIHILINTCMGFVKGFGLNLNILMPSSLIINLISTTLNFIGIEFMRALILKYLNKRNVLTQLLIPTLIFGLMPLTITRILYINNLNETMKLITSRIIPGLTKNMLATYLLMIYGPLTSLTYMGIMNYYTILTPVLPTLDWLTRGIIGVISPALSFTFVFGLLNTQISYIKKLKLNTSSSVRTLITLIALVLIAWFTIGNMGLKIAVIASTSMYPVIDVGDVVISIKDRNVRIGDIIEYWDPRTKNIIVHRVIDTSYIKGKLMYITKGDANKDKDPYPVAIEQIIGKVIAVIPKIGWISLWLKSLLQTLVNYVKGVNYMVIEPILPLTLTSVITYKFMSTKFSKLNNGSRPKKIKTYLHKIIPFIVILVLCSALLLFINNLPDKEVVMVKKGKYSHIATYNYTAILEPNILYNKTIIGYNETIYTPLLKMLNITLRYHLQSIPSITSFYGTYKFRILIEDPDKWSKEYMSLSEKEFLTPNLTYILSINFTKLSDLVKSIRKELDLPTAAQKFYIHIIPVIDTKFRIKDRELSEELKPILSIEVDNFNKKLVFTGLEYKVQKDIKDKVIRTKTLNILGLTLSISMLRYMLYLALIPIVLAIPLTFIISGGKVREVKLIEQIMNKYKDLIINVKEIKTSNPKHYIEVSSFEELVKIAINIERPILHEVRESREGIIHQFRVIGDCIYTYKLLESSTGSS